MEHPIVRQCVQLFIKVQLIGGKLVLCGTLSRCADHKHIPPDLASLEVVAPGSLSTAYHVCPCLILQHTAQFTQSMLAASVPACTTVAEDNQFRLDQMLHVACLLAELVYTGCLPVRK